MHSRLWGRAEAVRTCLRSSLEAVAPLAFGLLSSQLGQQTSGVGHPVAPIGAGAAGLDLTFLIMLAPVTAAALVVLIARRRYPRDVATAATSEEATSHPGSRP